MMRIFDWIDQHFRMVLFTLLTLVIGCVIAIVVAIVNNLSLDRTFVSISVAPSTAKIEIGDKVFSQGIFLIEPGRYHVTISADEFIAKTLEIEVKKNHTTMLTNYLLHKNDGIKYYERSGADIKILESISDDEEVKRFMDDYRRKISIKDILPMDVSFNDSIGSDSNNLVMVDLLDGSGDKRCDIAFCLMATGRKISVEQITNVLKTHGYDIDNYKVILNYEE